MKGFKEFLVEKFVNFLPDQVDEKEKYKDIVWDLIQTAYRDIGGIKGSGFSSKDDMVKNIPFWKLVRRSGEIVTVVMYKDKEGRKLVAAATNGSKEGKEGLKEIIVDDFLRNRAFSEVSSQLLTFIVNILGYDYVKTIAVPIEKVKEILAEDDLLPADHSDKNVVKHRELEGYFYQREIGGKLSTKILLGKSGNKIVYWGNNPSSK